ncbi:hypothetical protein ABKN59_001015 [Abortiporus biennis]
MFARTQYVDGPSHMSDIPILVPFSAKVPSIALNIRRWIFGSADAMINITSSRKTATIGLRWGSRTKVNTDLPCHQISRRTFAIPLTRLLHCDHTIPSSRISRF